jgi:hypothetical protein
MPSGFLEANFTARIGMHQLAQPHRAPILCRSIAIDARDLVWASLYFRNQVTSENYRPKQESVRCIDCLFGMLERDGFMHARGWGGCLSVSRLT